MNKAIFLCFTFAALSSFASSCPELAGVYQCSNEMTMQIQKKGSQYTATNISPDIQDPVVFAADGIVKVSRGKGMDVHQAVSCSDDGKSIVVRYDKYMQNSSNSSFLEIAFRQETEHQVNVDLESGWTNADTSAGSPERIHCRK